MRRQARSAGKEPRREREEGLHQRCQKAAAADWRRTICGNISAHSGHPPSSFDLFFPAFSQYPARPPKNKTGFFSLIFAFCRRDAALFESVGLALDAVDVNYVKTYTVAACNPLNNWAAWLPPQVATPHLGPPRQAYYWRWGSPFATRDPKKRVRKPFFGCPKHILFWGKKFIATQIGSNWRHIEPRGFPRVL